MTNTERRLLAICRRLLGDEAVELDDDYEAIGGTSLDSEEILASIYDAFSVRIPSEIVASARTIADLAVIVDRSQEAEQTVIYRLKADAQE